MIKLSNMDDFRNLNKHIWVCVCTILILQENFSIGYRRSRKVNTNNDNNKSFNHNVDLFYPLMDFRAVISFPSGDGDR